MGRFEITGKKVVSGVHRVLGNKNAALPMIAAALLTSEPVTLENVPDIADMVSMLECARSFGASVVRKPHSSTVTIRAEKLKTARLDPVLAAKIRTSVLFAGPLLARKGRVSLPPPPVETESATAGSIRISTDSPRSARKRNIRRTVSCWRRGRAAARTSGGSS